MPSLLAFLGRPIGDRKALAGRTCQSLASRYSRSAQHERHAHRPGRPEPFVSGRHDALAFPAKDSSRWGGSEMAAAHNGATSPRICRLLESGAARRYETVLTT